MWSYMASCDRLACDSHAEVSQEFDLPQGWYEISLGMERDRTGESVSETVGVFCTLDHVIEALQLRQPSSQEHRPESAGHMGGDRMPSPAEVAVDVRPGPPDPGSVSPVDPPRPAHHRPFA